MKTNGSTFEAGIPKRLFEAATVKSNALGGMSYVVSRDGQRFLILAEIEKPTSGPLEVLVNWR